MSIRDGTSPCHAWSPSHPRVAGAWLGRPFNRKPSNDDDVIIMSDQATLSFKPLADEIVFGSHSIERVNIARIIQLAIAAGLLVYIQIALLTSSVPVIQEFARTLFLACVAGILVLVALYEWMNRVRATLYVTSLRIVEEGIADRGKTVLLRDFHYEYFESIELFWVRSSKWRFFRKVTSDHHQVRIFVTGLPALIYVLPAALCTAIARESRRYLANKEK